MRQPVAVTRNGRESCVLLSTAEYNRLKRRDREVLAIEDFTEADVEAVRRAKMSPNAASFRPRTGRVTLPAPVPGLVVRYA